MHSISESGHPINVANFHELIATCIGFGSTYNPAKNKLKITTLQSLETTAQNALSDVIAKNNAFNNATNLRAIEYAGLRARCTRIINALQVTDATKETIKDAKGFNKKIQGSGSSKSSKPVDPNEPAPKEISNSQQSYDQLVSHFAGLLSLLSSEPSYTPNENDLKLTTLNAYKTQLVLRTDAVNTAHVQVTNARIQRDKILYTNESGLVDTALDVKMYVKSVYGASSAEYKQISKIPFKNYRR